MFGVGVALIAASAWRPFRYLYLALVSAKTTIQVDGAKRSLETLMSFTFGLESKLGCDQSHDAHQTFMKQPLISLKFSYGYFPFISVVLPNLYVSISAKRRSCR